MKKFLATLALSAGLASTTATAAELKVEPFNPGADAIFPVTSTLVYGEREALLVDAQFEARHARRLVEQVRASGRELKYVFISHSDPDFYFGLDVIKAAFPAAKIVSSAQTAWLISQSGDAKLAVWKDKLGDDAPRELIVPDAVGSDRLTIDGEPVMLRANPADSAHGYLWIPSTRTVLGGIPVTSGQHLWMADTNGVAGIDQWIRRIDDMKALEPRAVIPGHALAMSTAPAQLDFVRDYLTTYRTALAGDATADTIVKTMTAAWPRLPGADSLGMGARVMTGKLPWKVWSPYPPIGRVLTVDLEGARFDLTFDDNRRMRFIGTAGQFKGVADTVDYEATEIAPRVFMVYWHEPGTGDNVVHIQDYNDGVVYSNIARKDGSFLHLRGKLGLR